MSEHDVIIVGAGAAGLSAARVLRRAGVQKILVLERESRAGGLPRHSDHPGFGFSQFKRPYRGPDYAARLIKECEGIDIRTSATVCDILPGGALSVASQSGMDQFSAKAVLLTTGTREMAGVSRLVGSSRPWGLFTTGAIQKFIHDADHIPCKNPVIVGSEWVSFSVVLTLRKVGVKPAAILEAGSRAIASEWVGRTTELVCRIPLLRQARLLRIMGESVVNGIEYEQQGQVRQMNCDAVIFTGQFVPEASLAASGHIRMNENSQGPEIDQYWRCSDPTYFAAGNVLRPVESSGVAGREGEAAAQSIAAHLQEKIPAGDRIPVTIDPPFEYIYPQVIVSPGKELHPLHLRTRATRTAKGVLQMVRNGETVWKRRITANALQRIRLPVRKVHVEGLKNLEVKIAES